MTATARGVLGLKSFGGLCFGASKSNALPPALYVLGQATIRKLGGSLGDLAGPAYRARMRQFVAASQTLGEFHLATQASKLAIVVMTVVLLAGCSGQGQMKTEPTPDTRVDLSAHGLPNGFFRADADTKCGNQIIGYRFVVWLDNQSVAVGFNTSPNCRSVSGSKVDGQARVLLFDLRGTLKASRDLSYEADGDGILVAEGEAGPGPRSTLLFRIQQVHHSKSGLILLDSNLKDAARVDRFLERTTFVDHALVFQEPYTSTYSIWNGLPLLETRRWEQQWPIGTMDRKFGEHGVAYMLCQQELQPNVYISTDVVYANAKRRCSMVVEADDRTGWKVPLQGEGTAVIVGLLSDGTVVGQVPVTGRKDRQLVIWKGDQPTETLPWIDPQYCGSIQSATANMSRYGVFAKADCRSDTGRWIVFDRKLPTPIVDRAFPRNGRAALSPDGSRYATFESGELRIFSLPKLQ